MHVQHHVEAVFLRRVDALQHLVQVGHVVLTLLRLQARPQHAQPDHVVSHAGHQPSVILRVGIPFVRVSSGFFLSTLTSEPCIKMGGDRHKRGSLHHHIVPMEYSFPSVNVYNPVCVWVHIEFSSGP